MVVVYRIVMAYRPCCNTSAAAAIFPSLYPPYTQSQDHVDEHAYHSGLEEPEPSCIHNFLPCGFYGPLYFLNTTVLW